MVQDKRQILLVTESNPQSQLFTDYLHQQLECPVGVVAPGTAWKPRENNGDVLVLLDADHMDEASMQAWQTHRAEHPNISLAAFNLRDEDHAVETLSGMHLQGIFYRNDPLPLICKGLSTLLDGQLWMSRQLMARMLEFYRRHQINAYRPACGLTQRELEIIGLLGSGASNMEIADRLFVSEHTVKSHLYNIFKKIEVHNRLQAVNWARQNLGTPPPLTERRSNCK
ncbi:MULTISPECIES: LuxR C-terminal-related transcriptional regulator [Halomonas]|uniref:LuxR family transcriptional regulator of csgAB operon n=1 Tax=Halomonas stenophila TaxID=795312 RepID=A0A7W5HJ89_9GAMM|nr:MULTISPECIES: LuxR C-terminal-related transcriptional regulator [Halomonas]MBB3230620.1 LuxR family transcriptional regulator of csgAB operon [Halomonas stenophila]UYG07767.1 LuxR C-terminal-related transcriptional regulator [Halomonas sp. M4R1S46]